MADIKLLTTGGYKGLEQAVGKTVEAKKFLGCWLVSAVTLTELGCKTCMKDYAFLQREVEVTWHSPGLLR